jgi:DNA-binding transcriptional ArsR family regulator
MVFKSKIGKGIMIPESKLIKKELVFRVMAFDPEIKLSKKSIIRFIALSLGLISPKETRKHALAILEILLDEFLQGRGITASEIIKKASLESIDDKTVYYHLKKLEEFGFATKKGGGYFIGDSYEKNLLSIVKSHYSKNIDEMLQGLEKAYLSLKSRSE